MLIRATHGESNKQAISHFVDLPKVGMLCRWLKSNKRSLSSPAPPAIQHSSSVAELRRRLLITLLEVLFYYFPSLLTNTLSLFACFHIDPSGPANAQYHNAQVSLDGCNV